MFGYVIKVFYRPSGRPLREAEKLEKTLDYYLIVSSLPTRPLITACRIINIENIQGLHNATQDQLNTLTSDKNVFACMTYLLDTSFDWSNSLRLCDSVITDSIVSHSLGNNQTVLSYAHNYLKVRGIQ